MKYIAVQETMNASVNVATISMDGRYLLVGYDSGAILVLDSKLKKLDKKH